MNANDRIANALEQIVDKGITVHIVFPDDTDKFVTDLPAMKIVDVLERIENGIWHLNGDD